jgi:hypothetical protein
MSQSANFVSRRLLAVCVTALFAAGNVAAEDSSATIRLYKDIAFDVSIDPDILTLNSKPETLGGESGGSLNIVITPDRKIGPPPCRGFACQIQTKVVDVMDGLDQKIQNGVLTQFSSDNAAAIETVKSSYGDDVASSESFNNDPAAAGALEADGYRNLMGGTYEYEGQTYLLTQWSKFSSSGGATATATVNIKSDSNLDYEAGVFQGAFATVDEIDFSLDPEAAASAETSRLYEEYKAGVRNQVTQALTNLNKPRRLLNAKETDAVLQAGIGETLDFNKRINFDWFDGRKSAAVSISVTVVDIDYPDGQMNPASDSTESDYDWLYSPAD